MCEWEVSVLLAWVAWEFSVLWAGVPVSEPGSARDLQKKKIPEEEKGGEMKNSDKKTSIQA